MTDIDERETKAKPAADTRPPKLELKKTVETGQVRQSFAHGRSKMVTVEVRKKRTFSPEAARGRAGEERDAGRALGRGRGEGGREAAAVNLTTQEKAARVRALQDAKRAEEDRAQARPAVMFEPVEPPPPAMPAAEVPPAPPAAVETVVVEAPPGAVAPAEAETAPAAAEAAGAPLTAEAAAVAEESVAPPEPVAAKPAAVEAAAPAAPAKAPERPGRPAARAEAPQPSDEARRGALETAAARLRARDTEEAEETGRGRAKRGGAAKPEARRQPAHPVRRLDEGGWRGKVSLTEALDEGGERVRSLASVRRARQKERLKTLAATRQEAPKVVRDVIVPETITVQELANRMAERAADVVKCLMRMGVMATITQTIDGDTAELVVAEFGHNVRRVSEADVELGLRGEADEEGQLLPRPPVVTVMGHVDHGKTSLLDALRRTDVAAHEAGGITQHIGAYQVTVGSGQKITFIDTPGHAAFTQMRARGAKVTDIVILVVAADDGVMPQTVEAISHARAAGVPIIVAINKIDKPDANPKRVINELLQHGVVPEEMGGETLCVEISAKQRINLDKLVEAVLLQAEVLDLKANPNRPAEGVIIETKIERGRGPVATVLVQRGTLRLGDNFVAGSEWGKIRGLTDANGKAVEAAEPGQPVEVLGLNGTPRAGDDFIVVDSESRARDVAEFRQRRLRDARVAPAQRGTLEQMMTKIREGEGKELPVVVKADVHGSAEAIVGALEKLGRDEVKVNVLHAGVGGINESDVSLARASGALIIGFNVRANPQAREQARRDGVEIRYYSIIYDLTDDVKKVLAGMLAPQIREHTLGYAQIREVFNISKVGKVAGCMVTEGLVKRGARVRLLRDNVVIHEGEIGQLKRFKEDVREVKEGYDCGIALANYQDIQVGDIIECFEVEQVAQQL